MEDPFKLRCNIYLFRSDICLWFAHSFTYSILNYQLSEQEINLNGHLSTRQQITFCRGRKQGSKFRASVAFAPGIASFWPPAWNHEECQLQFFLLLFILHKTCQQVNSLHNLFGMETYYLWQAACSWNTIINGSVLSEVCRLKTPWFDVLNSTNTNYETRTKSHEINPEDLLSTEDRLRADEAPNYGWINTFKSLPLHLNTLICFFEQRHSLLS